MYFKHMLATRGIANKGFSGMRSLVARLKVRNGGYRHSPQSLTGHTANWRMAATHML